MLPSASTTPAITFVPPMSMPTVGTRGAVRCERRSRVPTVRRTVARAEPRCVKSRYVLIVPAGSGGRVLHAGGGRRPPGSILPLPGPGAVGRGPRRRARVARLGMSSVAGRPPGGSGDGARSSSWLSSSSSLPPAIWRVSSSRVIVVLGVAAGHGAALEQHETVADQVGVVRVVGDEDHAEAGVAGGGDVLEDHAGLLDAEGGGRLVEDEDLGAEVDGAGDGHALALAAGEGADGLVDVAQVDAHAQQLRAGGLAHQVDVEALEGAGALGRLGAEEEVPPDRHQRDDGEVLVDGGDAAVQGLARVGEARSPRPR